MKKIIALLLAADLALCGGLALAEGAGADAFAGGWVSPDGSMWISIVPTPEGYGVQAIHRKSPTDLALYTYSLTPDETGGVLSGSGGLTSFNPARDLDANGNLPTGRASRAVDGAFIIDRNGSLLWADLTDGVADGIAFRKIGAFVGDYFADRPSMEIRLKDGHAAVSITWGDSAFETWVWQLTGDYEPSVGGLSLTGTLRKVTGSESAPGDQGEEAVALFTFDENGYLIWTSPDGQADGFLFEKTDIPIWNWGL